MCLNAINIKQKLKKRRKNVSVPFLHSRAHLNFLPACLCLTWLTLWNMHEMEPDTKRSCGDVSFRQCNTGWPDICKIHVNTQPFVLERHQPSWHLPLSPLQLQFPYRLSRREPPWCFVYPRDRHKRSILFSECGWVRTPMCQCSGQWNKSEVGLLTAHR